MASVSGPSSPLTDGMSTRLGGQRRAVELKIHPVSLGHRPWAPWGGNALAAARSAVTITATEGRRTLAVRATA